MKKIAITIFFFSLLGVLSGQNCMTPASPDYLKGATTQFLPDANLSFTVKVFVHIINKDDGTGGPTVEEVMTELDRLEAYYEPHDICFSLTGIDMINDSEYGDSAGDTISPAQSNQIISDYPPIPDVVDLYILPEDIFFRGTAYAIPNTYLLIYAGRFNTCHMAHEMGHCLGLYHTHETAFGAELVDGSNCGSAGDKLCDTPADPLLPGLVDNNCVYTGTGTDANGDMYNPDVTNTMSYAPFGCRGSFTQDQEDRIHSILMSNFTVNNKILVEDQNLVICCGSINSGLQLETSLNYIESYDYEVTSSAVGHFIAEDYVSLQPGFKAEPNSSGEFWAVINAFCDGDFPDGVPVNSLIGTPPSLISSIDLEENEYNGTTLALYPNPTSSLLNVDYTLDESDIIRITLVNQFGQELQVIENDQYREKGSYELDIDMDRWPGGTYYLVFLNSQEKMVKPFVVSR